MRKHILGFIAMCLITMLQLAWGQSKVSAIEARLFYNEDKEMSEVKVSGGFSENVIGNPDISLWNTIIGEGSAEGYSHQTIVVVTVSVKGASNQDQALQFTARAGNKVIKTEKRMFSVIGENTSHKLLFLLNDTGCEEISISASLVKAGKSISSMNKKIPFTCGE
ncbi:MAG TPA: hypothetical protein PLL64_07215 [Rhodothermales bacterium]|nr:hypothetical protein [Rhodothermales bacterium]HRR09623.1 hypothetical protein [Rhodothermales bacterium]